MKKLVKVLLFIVLLLPNTLNSDTSHRHHVYKAFKNCKNKTECVARVSLCIIMKDCGCGVVQQGKTCNCSDDCRRCLGAQFWSKCCDCVGLCSNVSLNETGSGVGIPSKSGDLPGQALLTLFEALSKGSELPILFMTRPRRGTLLKHGASSRKHQCKVAFLDKCITREGCLNSCSSMGAHRYRWFRNGCCQCIDQRCHDYGELEPHCKECLAK